MSEVGFYLENNPVLETATLAYGEVRLRQDADSMLIDAYQHLEQYGYITMELLKSRKRFLRKDSMLIYEINLLETSIPFVLDKTDKSAEVTTYYYELDESVAPHIELRGKNRARVTVTLRQRETDFAMFSAGSKSNHASFIKQTYNLRFDDDYGWRIAR